MITRIYLVQMTGFALDAVGLSREFLRVTQENRDLISQRADLEGLLELCGDDWCLVLGPPVERLRLPLIQAICPQARHVQRTLRTRMLGPWKIGEAKWKESRQI